MVANAILEELNPLKGAINEHVKCSCEKSSWACSEDESPPPTDFLILNWNNYQIYFKEE
jgi:hypothetical protein